MKSFLLRGMLHKSARLNQLSKTATPAGRVTLQVECRMQHINLSPFYASHRLILSGLIALFKMRRKVKFSRVLSLKY